MTQVIFDGTHYKIGEITSWTLTFIEEYTEVLIARMSSFIVANDVQTLNISSTKFAHLSIQAKEVYSLNL